MEDWQNGGFGLYVHWPFCESKCPYCDFNSHVATRIDQAAWKQAYLREMARIAELVPGRSLQTIYFGGGTPSLMAPETVAAIIDAASRHWAFSNEVEITLEANPGSVETSAFADFRAAGVNRTSLGVQALNDTDLRRLGRKHDLSEARRAIDIAQSTFDRVSFDLIYARQYQSLSDWENELAEALRIGTSHLSLYQLTIEDGTVFGERFARGQLKGLPPEDLAADFFDLTQTMCAEAGLPAYEVSNHARPGQESRHNRIYWTGGDYAGIGPGAHGRLTYDHRRHATAATERPADWLAEAMSAGGVADNPTALSPQEQAMEYLLMGLRLRDGIQLSRLAGFTGRDLPGSRLAGLKDLGLLQHSDDTLSVTDKGRPLLNAILAELAVDI